MKKFIAALGTILVAGTVAWAANNWAGVNGDTFSGYVQMWLKAGVATPVTTTDPLPVTATITPSGTQNVNVTQVGGGALALGQQTKAASIPVVIASDQGALAVSSSSPYPSGAVPLTISATGTTGATAATLAGTSGKTTYICGFSITSDATAGLAGGATLAGVVVGTMTFLQGVGVAPAVSSLDKNFSPCIPASATNTGIVITSAAAGIGGNTNVNAWGYQL